MRIDLEIFFGSVCEPSHLNIECIICHLCWYTVLELVLNLSRSKIGLVTIYICYNFVRRFLAQFPVDPHAGTQHNECGMACNLKELDINSLRTSITAWNGPPGDVPYDIEAWIATATQRTWFFCFFQSWIGTIHIAHATEALFISFHRDPAMSLKQTLGMPPQTLDFFGVIKAYLASYILLTCFLGFVILHLSNRSIKLWVPNGTIPLVLLLSFSPMLTSALPLALLCLGPAVRILGFTIALLLVY